MNGNSDKPVMAIKEDSFHLKKYVEGLSQYILKCETPTTLAVQGDWGCGKTSMLNMVRENLGDKVKSLWFNTWQYSKFNLGDQLPISLLSHLYDSLAKDNAKEPGKVADSLRKLKRASIKLTSYVIDSLGAQKFAEELDQMGSQMSDGSDDVIDAIENLKDDFQKEINRASDNGKRRVVVFIDDLDRLEPAKAVDLMEILKLFLDCENCVYVLAIDYDVVTRGISQKYGEDFGKKQSRKFFDKIIQVPFMIPVEKYQIDEYIRNSFPENMKIAEGDLEQYIGLIKNSVGCNPRTMKRLFNAYLLISMINSDEGIEKDPMAQKLLFAILCMQLSMEDIYRGIVEMKDDPESMRECFADFLGDADGDTVEKHFPEIQDDELNPENAAQFLKKLAGIMAVGTKNSESASEVKAENIEKLAKILSISASTGNVTATPRWGAGELEEDTEVEKTVNETDCRYHILTAGSRLHIGFNERITVIYNGKEYKDKKMHSTTKGRIDGLVDLYNDVGFKPGDRLKLSYDYANRRVTCEKL